MEAHHASIDDNLKIYPITNRSIHLQSAIHRALDSGIAKQALLNTPTVSWLTVPVYFCIT